MKFSFLIVALLLPLTLAAPVSDSDEMVQTPGGMLPASSVHPVPEGGAINIAGDEIQLLDASKHIVHVAQVNNTKPRVPQQSGWIAYAYWYNTGSPISYFNTTWSVPPVPATNHGQLVYLFNSIEPASYNAILQPVLQYGVSPAGGGSYWAVSNWYVTGSVAYFTPLARVNVGQTLTGIIALTGTTGSGYNYYSGFSNVGGALQLWNTTQLVWATETLEAYGITTGTDYPQGSTLFSSINLFTQSASGTPSVSWSTSSDAADGVSATVVKDGAVNAQVNIKYET